MSSIYGGAPPGAAKTTQNVVPLSGDTVLVASGQNNVLLWLAPAATLAALTIQLPSDANSFVGEEVQVGSSKTITALTFTGAASIFDTPSTFNPGDLVVMERVAAGTWTRQQ